MGSQRQWGQQVDPGEGKGRVGHEACELGPSSVAWRGWHRPSPAQFHAFEDHTPSRVHRKKGVLARCQYKESAPGEQKCLFH